MKKYFLSLGLLLMVGMATAVFNSCSKEDNNTTSGDNNNGGNTSKNPFVGTWKMTIDERNWYSYTFYADKTFKSVSRLYVSASFDETTTTNGTYDYNSTTLSLVYSDGKAWSPWYEFIGNALVLDFKNTYVKQ